MKFRMKVLVSLSTAVVICNAVTTRGQETFGITLDRWWHFGDVALSFLLGIVFAYPFLILVEQRKAVLRQRQELAVARKYQTLLAKN
jgi:hypothetical protein